jgi:hypothetical protein
VCDLSSDFEVFEEKIGVLLQKYVEKGGTLCFPTTDGLTLQPTLERLFRTGWKASGYYRATWGVVAKNEIAVRQHFGVEAGSDSYSARCCALKQVSSYARCYGVLSRTEAAGSSPSLAVSPK